MTEEQARRVVYARSGRRCEACTAPATDYAHRMGRGQLGLWLPSNALDQCHRCHMWGHAEPTLAEELGWKVLSGEHPAEVPVWMRSSVLIGWHLLDDEGFITPLWERDDVPVLPPWVKTYDRIAPGKSQR